MLFRSGNYEGNNGDNGGNTLTALIEDFATPLAMLPLPAKAGIAVTVAVLAGGFIWFLLFRRKRKKEDGK